MKKGRTVLKKIGIIAAVFMVIMVVMIVFLTRGLNQMMALDISEVNLAVIPDGTYQGQFEGYRWSNTVEVTVQHRAITGIRVVQPHLFHRPELVDELTSSIISQQTLQLDAVTGATVSSKAFLKAVEDALTMD